jgi:hypothetical protein
MSRQYAGTAALKNDFTRWRQDHTLSLIRMLLFIWIEVCHFVFPLLCSFNAGQERVQRVVQSKTASTVFLVILSTFFAIVYVRYFLSFTLIHSLILSFSHPLILSSSHSLILSSSHSLILSFSHSLILSFSHSLILFVSFLNYYYRLY